MASYQSPVYNRSLLAAVDLSDKQFYYVGENGSNKYNVTGHDTLGLWGGGFLMNNPKINEACVVATIGGGAKGVAAGTIAVKAKIIAKADGTLITLPAGSAGDVLQIIAIALEAAVSGDHFAIQPIYDTKTVHA